LPKASSAALSQRETDVLKRVLRRVEDGPGVVVFDLDSTLLDNRPRQAQILRDFGALRRLTALNGLTAQHFEDWDLRRAMRNAGVDPETVEQVYADARAFWQRWFFSNAYCHLDVPVKGAPEFVAEVRKAGGKPVYLSGRPEGMRPGTMRSLAAHGFPLAADEVTVLLKPNPQLPDDVWKAQACATVATLGSVIAAFDNEPTHINRYRSEWPEALCVHLQTDHSGRHVELLPDIQAIADFVPSA
jgi:hypothetical protein